MIFIAGILGILGGVALTSALLLFSIKPRCRICETYIAKANQLAAQCEAAEKNAEHFRNLADRLLHKAFGIDRSAADLTPEEREIMEQDKKRLAEEDKRKQEVYQNGGEYYGAD